MIRRNRGSKPFMAFGIGLALSLAFLSSCDRTSRRSAVPRLRLNEVMAKNDSFLVPDASGRKVVQDWVEVHNPNPSAVSLAGFSLTDNPGKPKKFVFPVGAMIPAGGFVVVFLNDEEKCAVKCDTNMLDCEEAAGGVPAKKDACEKQLAECMANCMPAGFVADFNLSNKGEAVFLFADDGTQLMDRIGVKNQLPNVANGIDPVTGELGVIYLPTPGAPNQRINLKPPRFASGPFFTPAPDEKTEVTVTFTVDRDMSAPGALDVRLEFADLSDCLSSLEDQALTQVPVVEVAGATFLTDTSRVDSVGSEVDIPVMRRSFQAFLPPAPCGVNRVFHVIASDPTATVVSAQVCVPYCFVPATVEVNEYQPRNTKITFEHVSSKTGQTEVNTPDWIEIFNFGDQPVDIRNLGLVSAKDIATPNWLFGREGRVVDPLPAKGFLLVLADNDGGTTRRVYHRVGGDPAEAFFSTRFKLDPHPKPGNPFDSFALVTSTGIVIDRVLLDFTANGGDIQDDQSVGRFEGEDDIPNVLVAPKQGIMGQGTIANCPTPKAPNSLVCEVPPVFDEVVTRDTAGPTRCPAPGEPVIVHARVNFDRDTSQGQVEVRFSFTVNGGPPVFVPPGPDLVVSTAPDQSKAAPASTLYDITARIPGQEDKALVVFSFLASDLRLGSGTELNEANDLQVSFEYLVGFELPSNGPRVNEVLPGNKTILLPPFVGTEAIKHPDFAEVFNPSSEPLDLAGFHLTNSPSPDSPIERARLFTFPAGSVLPANGFLGVYFGKLPEGSSFIQVDGFNLNDCGETLHLIAPDGQGNCVLDSFTWDLTGPNSCKIDQAVGRVCDGDERVVELSRPTPGKSNVLPTILHDSFHQAVIPPEARNECVPADSDVQLSAVIFLDPVLKAAFPENRGISSALFLVDRGSGEEQIRAAQFASFPSCNDSRRTDCATPPPGYENLAFRVTLTRPQPGVVRYRIRVVDACASVLEAGPFSFGSTAGAHPPLAINEINRAAPVLPEGAPRPWIEIFNRSSSEVDLSGMFLTDDPSNPRKAELPDGARAPGGGVLLVLTNGAAEDPFNTIAKLDWVETKGTLFLLDSLERGTCIVDKLEFDFTGRPSGSSLGRDPDGTGDIQPLDQPSPGQLNGNAPQTFVRGDVNSDLKVNIADMTRLLAILFSGDTRRPACEDAMDANDDGKVNDSDVAFIGASLVDKDKVIPPPFPNPGVDPTPDELSPCRAP